MIAPARPRALRSHAWSHLAGAGPSFSWHADREPVGSDIAYITHKNGVQVNLLLFTMRSGAMERCMCLGRKAILRDADTYALFAINLLRSLRCCGLENGLIL
jgi:hypothetical protein